MWDLCVPMRVTFPGRTLPFLIVRGTVVHRLSSSVRPRARVLSLARLQVPFVPKTDQYILLLHIPIQLKPVASAHRVPHQLLRIIVQASRRCAPI